MITVNGPNSICSNMLIASAFVGPMNLEFVWIKYRNNAVRLYTPDKGGHAFKHILIEKRIAWVLGRYAENRDETLQYALIPANKGMPCSQYEPHDTYEHAYQDARSGHEA